MMEDKKMARQASFMEQGTPVWVVYKKDENGLALVRNAQSWNAYVFDSEDEARAYGRMNVFPAYTVERVMA
jgi:uncharacterized protein YkuJ